MAESKEEKTGPPHPGDKPEEEPADAQRAPGTPDPGNILYEKPFVSPKGRGYRIIVTDEVDPYEEPLDAGKRGPLDGG